MVGRLRSSGINIIGDVSWGTHFCQFYQTKKDLTDILIPYFKAGLENNEFCLWVTSQPLEVGEAKEALGKAVPDIDIYLKKGQIEIISCNHLYLKEGSFDSERIFDSEKIFDSERILQGCIKKLNKAPERGYDGLRFSWNASCLEKESWNLLVEYKERIGKLIDNHRLVTLFTYSLDRSSATEIIDVVANHQFVLFKKEGKWEKIENSGRKNVTECKRPEEAPRQSEQRGRLKLESILSPDGDTANLELADILDTRAIQSLMDDFYKLVKIPIGLNDLKGNVIVGAGWQDTCTKFHRVHPETRRHCVESNTNLSSGVAPGEFKMYRCKNNMWDIATPIIVGGQHVGNIFSGQFFFEDEPLDYELFRSQARKYGFNEEEYIAAL